MADRPRGRGRGGGRGRGRGQAGGRRNTGEDDMRNVPWKLLLGFRRLSELVEKQPNEIVLTLTRRQNALKEALNEEHDDKMIALLLRCLSKACECQSLRENVINLFVILEDSVFFKTKLPGYIFALQYETSPERQLQDKQALRDILVVVKEFRLKMPRSILVVMGMNSMLGVTFRQLREKSSSIVDDEMWEDYVEYKESQENALKRMSEKKKDTKREDFNEEDPPDDFRQLTVFPEHVDVRIDKIPFVRRNKAVGGYENVDHYLDVQFRLLREDFIGPLRDGIKDYIQTMHETGKTKRLQELRIYSDVRIISPVCNSSGLCRRISFYCKGMDRIRWESSRRLIYGSLLCLSNDNFQTLLFATVANRDLKNIKKGLIDVKFETDNKTISNLPKDNVFVMAETTAYFEAYRHVLLGLQNLQPGDLPFEKYIVRCSTDSQLPDYLRRNQGAVFDLRPLVDEDMIIIGKRNIPGNREDNPREQTYDFSRRSEDARRVKVDDLKTWPAPDLFHLDMSQFRAVQNALSREFAIIQGPPGTGKTYIGLKVVKALLHNIQLWNRDPNTGELDSRPLLVVCYTNHALDQFLEGIVKFFKGDVLRLGSRSSSEVMKQLNISNMRMTMRRRREVPREIHLGRMETKHTMKSLQEEINKISERIELAKREVLHEDTLEMSMGKLYPRLIRGFEIRLQDMYDHGYEINKKQKHSALLEWLGYGDLFAPNDSNEIQNNENEQGPENEQNVDGDLENEENQDELMDEFINVIDGLDAEMNMRQLAVDDEEEENEDALVAEMEQALKDLDVRRPVVALDVSKLDADDKQNAEVQGGWQITRKQKKQLKKKIRKELASADIMDVQEVVRIRDIWLLSGEDKWRLYRYWVNKYCESLQEKIRDKEETFQQACDRYNEVLMQEDREIMRYSTVIGLTTTCAARYQSVLQEIGPRVIVVEEAAEVLEAHIVTTLSRNCQHLILIGDHQQLKPNPTVYKLATKYNLEISLFERMIKNSMKYDCLMYQHRMRPTISKMMKKIYPELKDDDAVKGYGDVRGVSANVFFIDHTHAESAEEDLKSHSNEHEADYVVALCRYLLLQGYEREQITVLTLYSGQLFALRRKMPKVLFEGVRVTVVDNYQGEENDIVLLSLVRSNEDGKIGFLSIDNRVCVALSRAKIGFYVIGNFTLMSDKSKLWSSIVDHARRNALIGEGLPLYCQNHHSDDGLKVISPSDFKKAPEGGCMKPCEFRLPCGHTCSRVCHTYDKDHENYECNKACTKKICERGHQCRRRCNQECGKCDELVPKRLPKCGHTEMIPCYIEPSNWRCSSRCRDRLPCGHPCRNLCGEAHTEYCAAEVQKQWDCGHSGNIRCCQKDLALCNSPCSQELECGHLCTGTCGECYQGRLHVSCKKACRRPLVCEHPCRDRCSNCPPCKRRCENRCKHSACGKECGEICVPCAELCEWQCRHHRCDKICSEPCDRERCNRPCRLRIACGHPCIGLCGEPCPTFCRECSPGVVSEVFFGTEDEPDARFVQLEDCGHIFEVSGLDHWMDRVENETSDAVIKLKECPRCKTVIRRNLRYGNMIKQALQDIEQVKKTMLGDKYRKRHLERSISEGLPDISTPDARRLREFHSEFTKGSYDENVLLAIDNQIAILKHLNKLKTKFTKAKTSGRFTQIYENALNDLDVTHKFTLKKRRYFTTQETTDCQAELDRLVKLLTFMKYKERKQDIHVTLPTDVNLEFLRAEPLLTDGRRFTQQRSTMVDATIEKLKKYIPLSGLGITNEERLSIVQAMGLSQGHWYKCPRGHVYAIGDCGGATVESKCPECGSGIGGTSHRLRDDNRVATEMDGATHSAWSEQAFLGNYDPFEIRFQ